MKTILVLALVAIFILSGCVVEKSFVQKIEEHEKPFCESKNGIYRSFVPTGTGYVFLCDIPQKDETYKSYQIKGKKGEQYLVEYN